MDISGHPNFNEDSLKQGQDLTSQRSFYSSTRKPLEIPFRNSLIWLSKIKTSHCFLFIHILCYTSSLSHWQPKGAILVTRNIPYSLLPSRLCYSCFLCLKCPRPQLFKSHSFYGLSLNPVSLEKSLQIPQSKLIFPSANLPL